MTDSNTRRIHYLHTLFYGLRNAVAACMAVNWVRIYTTAIYVRVHVNVVFNVNTLLTTSLLFGCCFLCVCASAMMFDGATQMYLCTHAMSVIE